MFPVHTVSGKVVAFGGRLLQNNPKAGKYINSPESEIYHKSDHLYGIYFAKQAIIQKDFCIMVEGYLDVISLHQAGIKNVVASSGTSLTIEQIRLVHRFTNNMLLLYDGDKAGIKAGTALPADVFMQADAENGHQGSNKDDGDMQGQHGRVRIQKEGRHREPYRQRRFVQAYFREQMGDEPVPVQSHGLRRNEVACFHDASAVNIDQRQQYQQGEEEDGRTLFHGEPPKLFTCAEFADR
jgi:DNA primase catalytic core